MVVEIVTHQSDQLSTFFTTDQCQLIANELGKTVWIVTDVASDGQWSGLLLYSFMYSTWTRYNPFVLFATGDNIRTLIAHLRGVYPGLPVRGYVQNGTDSQIIAQAKPVNLTKTEDWVWLRLEDLEAFEQCRQKGQSRASELGLEMSITPAKAGDDFDQIQLMIEELAIYENMLDQCHMTVEKLTQDYKDTTTLHAPKYHAHVARLGDKVIGYTVAIDFFTLDHGKETYLEDLFIREEYRRKGLGSQLLHSVWQAAKKRESKGLYWVCLGWNKSSMDFYHSLGAVDQPVTFIRFEPDCEY